MRAALLGVCLGQDPQRLRAYVRASTRLTHTDPRAERGAFLVALAAHYGAKHGPDGVRAGGFLREARAALPDMDEKLRRLLDQLEDRLHRDTPVAELANLLGLSRGVSGYMYHTVPMVLYGWLRHPGDFRQAVEEVIALGGDADSTGAVVGGIVGATVGASGIPADWRDGLLEWPRTVAWMGLLAERLAQQFPATRSPARQKPLALFWPGLVPRNLLFLAVVLAHVFRRLLPPY